jgi:hypothetical protein
MRDAKGHSTAERVRVCLSGKLGLTLAAATILCITAPGAAQARGKVVDGCAIMPHTSCSGGR